MTGARRLRSIYRSTAHQREIRDWCTRRLDGWQLPHRRDEISSTAGPTHLVRAGSGAPTVVLVPGTNENVALAEPLAAALAPEFTVLLPDLPGQPGLSTGHRPGRNRLAWYGRWLAEVLEQLVPEKAIVVGHSLGGAVALACDSPRISGRVLVSPAGLARLAVSATVLRATVPWLLRPTPERSETLLRHFLAPGHPAPPHLIEWYTLLARACRTSLAPPVLPQALLARRGNVPNLVVTGQHDVFLSPQRLRAPADRHLGTELLAIPDAGHLLPDEQPQALAALVRSLR